MGERRMIDTPSGAMHLSEEGPPDGQALLLLHGTAGSIAWWDALLPWLAEFRVLRLDLLGHGSSAPSRHGYRIETQARAVGVVLAQLDVRSVVVAGHSTGGAVATSLAEQVPGLVSALALINTGPRVDAYLGASLLNRLLAAPVVGAALWALRNERRLRAGLSTAFSTGTDVPERLLPALGRMSRRAFVASSAASLRYLDEGPIPGRLIRTGLPVAVLFGSADRRWDPSSVNEYRLVSEARITVLDGVGHTPMEERPDATADLIRRLFTRSHR